MKKGVFRLGTVGTDLTGSNLNRYDGTCSVPGYAVSDPPVK